MKNLIAILILASSVSARAGGMSEIPIQLMEIDNQGRAAFIKNVLSETGLTDVEDVKYAYVKSIVVGGDEPGSDYKGGYFIFEAEISVSNSTLPYQKHRCHQFLSVGTFEVLHPELSRPVFCEKL